MSHQSGLGHGVGPGGPGYAFNARHPSEAHHQAPFQSPHPEHFPPTSPIFTGSPTLAGSVTPSCTTPPMGTTGIPRFPLRSPTIFHGEQHHGSPVSPSRNVMDPNMQMHYAYSHFRNRRPSYSEESSITSTPGGPPHLPGYPGAVMNQPMPNVPSYPAQNIPNRNQPAKGTRRNPGLRIDFSLTKGADEGTMPPNTGPYPSQILRSPTYQNLPVPGGSLSANVSEEVRELRRKVAEYVYQNIEVVKKRYQDSLQELFFLQHAGNIVDFLIWKRKPSPQWITFQATHKLEDDVDFLIPAASPFGPNQVHNVGNIDYITLHHKFYAGGNPSAGNVNQAFGTVMSPSVPPFGNIPTSQSPHLSAHVSNNPTGAHIDLSSSKLFLSKDSGFGQALSASTVRHSSATTSAQGGLSDGRSLVFREASHSKEDIMLEARKEADILKRVAQLRKEGLWSTKRLPKVQEPSRNKAHWDYVLEEMAWLATDFAQEQRWKKGVAKKVLSSFIS